MDQSGLPRHASRGDFALLVDGENIAHGLCGEVLRLVEDAGKRRVFRVYGDAARCPVWAAQPGARFMQSGGHKNAADILLSIDASDLMHSMQIRTFAIASSDSDLSHIALYLVEHGCRVIGLGEAKAPAAFREACNAFHIIGKPVSTEQILAELSEIIASEGSPNGPKVSALNDKMRKRLGIKISERPEKTWRGFLLAHKDVFHVDPKGPNARVQMRRGASLPVSA